MCTRLCAVRRTGPFSHAGAWGVQRRTGTPGISDADAIFYLNRTAVLAIGNESLRTQLSELSRLRTAPNSRVPVHKLPRAEPVHGALTTKPDIQWRFFQNQIILFLDTLNQQIYFLIKKINNFWGDLSGISAKTAADIQLQNGPEPHVSKGLECAAGLPFAK